MIQSDALSRWPDFIPDKDTDNEDIVKLLDNLFIQLLDVDLQRRIANTHDHDEEVTKALATIVLQKLSWIGHVTAEPDISEDQLGLSSAPGSRHAGPAQMSATG